MLLHQKIHLLRCFIFLLSTGTIAQAFAADVPTFNKDIAPILFKNCAACHRPGEVAPFPLLTYADAKKKAKTIVRVTQDRIMPPWKAEHGFGEFVGERRLSDAQIALLQKWFDAGTPEGIGAPPAPPKFVEGWQLGEPDVILKMPEAFTVPAEGRDVYQCFVLPSNLTEDKYLTAVEYRPSNRRVVHHALLFLDTSGKARELDAADPGVGYHRFGGIGFTPSGGLGGWAPGAFPHPLPDGVVRVVKKNSDLIIQTHFHPNGKSEQEQSQVGLYFSRKPVKKLAMSFPLAFRLLNIPPGEKNYKVTASFVTPADVEVVGITPHAHLLGKEMKVTATLPNGAVQPMIWIKNWDFNWQDQYLYAKPIKLPKGTRLQMDYTYDNSSENPANPNNPPKRVTWGEQTTNEMAICFFQFVAENDALNAFLLDRAKSGRPLQKRQ